MINVADQRHGLRRQLLQAGEIQQISQSGVDQADDGDGGQVGAQRTREGRGGQDVQQYDKKGDVQLDRRRLQPPGALDSLVEDDQRGIEQRGEQRSQKTARAQTAEGDAAADTDKADGHGTDRRDLRAVQLFTEKQGREKQDQHRRGVIDQGRKADVQQPIGLEQRDPVRSERRAAQQQRNGLGPDGGAVKAAAQQHQPGQQHPAEQRAQQDHLAGRKRKARNEKPVRAEDQHRQDISAV